jgi:formylmethanofuran dehydrogenase subunit B
VTAATAHTDVTCTVCGCVCDDLAVRSADGAIVAVERACSLAEPWFLAQTSRPGATPTVNGRAVELETAIDAASDILRRSQAPLIYGLSRSSTPGQRAAVALADRLGAVIDTTASTCHAPSIVALQTYGESTASLGEVRQRSDLVIYWGSNPLDSHPRHLERLVEPAGEFVPAGRAGRYVVVVDVVPTATSAVADEFVQVTPGGDFDLLWALRAAAQGIDWSGDSAGGVPRAQVEALAARMRSCRYGALFFGLGLTHAGQPHLNVAALLQLVTDLHRHTRWIARRMRIPGDVAGADSVLCWQTGYPFSVDLSRGYPRYNPGEYTANNLLTRGDVDAALFVGGEGIAKLDPAAREYLREIDTIVLDAPTAPCAIEPTVSIPTATYGIHCAGTAYRMDEVPIPLRACLPTPLPADHEVLGRLLGNLTTGSSRSR